MRGIAIRIPILAVVVAAALLAGCGNKEDVVTIAKNEGIFVDVGPLAYQVQISRQLNPRDTEDRTYLSGLPVAARTLGPDETWFAVFLRVENDSDEPARAASDIEIVDTEDTVYRPVELASINPFAYRAALVKAGSFLPDPDSAAGHGPTQGSLVLFKLKLFSLQNRPLELRIRSDAPASREATIDLDV